MDKLNIALVAALIGSVITAPSVAASPASDNLATCLADNTTGKDRKDMARWIFVAMSAHPELHNLTQISQNDQNEVDKLMGVMVTKLMTESCPDETKKAIEEGGEAFKTAFTVLGQLAVQELMTNPKVKSSISGYGKYLDKDKFNSVFMKK